MITAGARAQMMYDMNITEIMKLVAENLCQGFCDGEFLTK
jgi:hypothetical protein